MDIVTVRFRTDDELQSAYNSELGDGGLFCPTTTPYESGDSVVVELSAPGLPNKVLIRGVVRAWRSALPRLRIRAGAMVEFEPSEEHKRDFILSILRGGGPKPNRRRHSRIPVNIETGYRLKAESDFADSLISEISIGGCTLHTEAPLPLDVEVILKILPPGSARALTITGRTTYRRPAGGVGVRWITRDSGGSRRIRELIRRIREG